MATSIQFDKFKKTLRSVFMLDQADLDFGIYRIMNQKRKDIEDYLNNNLKDQVRDILSKNRSTDSTKLEKELEEAIKNARSLGISPDGLPKVQELKSKIATCGSNEDLENEVYSHLSTFFSRYYDGGDFMTVRRYKKDVYAIPYEGEEVKMFWANEDQYYIKTGEYFKNYRFKLQNNKVVEFIIKEASTEINNNKEQDDMVRRFALFEECPFEIIDDVMHINFTYELYKKSTKQKNLVDNAYAYLIDNIPSDYLIDLSTLCPTETDKKRTLLQKHLNDYVARNTFDYFIHKDLKGFFLRELDFYIKNEILEIDDIDSRTTESFLAHLSTIKAVKNIGSKVIEFLSSLEEFQKRLWLKKKFVIQSDYCITLDRIPESLYPEICENNAQRERWVMLFSIDQIKGDENHTASYSNPLTVQFLKENKSLVLDTAYFSEDFKKKIVSDIEDFDSYCDGLLINSDNFHALELLKNKYQQQIKCIYIDPPYNSPSSEIPYKNTFKHSSWLSLLNDRMSLSKGFLKEDGSQIVAIDKNEHERLFMLINSIFRGYDNVSVSIEHNKKGAPRDHFSFNNEYAIFSVPFTKKHLNEIQRNKEDWDWSPLRNWGGESLREDAANCFFPIYIKNDVIIGYGLVSEDNFHPNVNEEINTNFKYFDIEGKECVCEVHEGDKVFAIYPIDTQGIERKWRYAFQSITTLLPFLRIKTNSGVYDIEMPKYSDQFKTLWYDAKYNAGDFGTKILTNMGISKSQFKFPKSIYTTRDCIYSVSEDNDIILDYFAGSGTTGHAIINMNREDKGGHRKFILVEMGEYFDTVTKPRIEKVMYSDTWKNGIPARTKQYSHCIKYLRLEQYEDTLNNLVIKKDSLPEDNGEFFDGYMLGYMLDTETKDSLFSLEWFKNPWNTKLNITKNNETKEEKVDLIETFNYMIGLSVKKIYYPKDNICVVNGYNNKHEHILIIWRDCTKVSNAELDTFFEKMNISTRDNEFDKIYVNGDNNLGNFKTEADTWKVSLIEQEFSKRMFETE